MMSTVNMSVCTSSDAAIDIARVAYVTFGSYVICTEAAKGP